MPVAPLSAATKTLADRILELTGAAAGPPTERRNTGT